MGIIVLAGVSCASASACTATGYYYNGSVYPTLAERWNGTKWSIEHTPNPDGLIAKQPIQRVVRVSERLHGRRFVGDQHRYVDAGGALEWHRVVDRDHAEPDRRA